MGIIKGDNFRNKDPLSPDSYESPAAMLCSSKKSEKKFATVSISISDCNKSFAKLLNRPKDKIIGTPFISHLAQFTSENGAQEIIPLSWETSAPPQTVFLKPKNQPPVSTAMLFPQPAKSKNSLLAVFNPINAELFSYLQNEIFRYKTASELWHVAYFDHNHQSGKVSLSPLFTDIYRVDVKEAETFETFGKFIHPDDIDREAVDKAHDPAGNGHFDKAFRIIRRDGEIRWIQSKSQTFFDSVDGEKQAVRTTGAIVDFTDEYILKEALKNSQRKLSDIINSLPSVILGIDSKKFIIHWNKKAESCSKLCESTTKKQKLMTHFPMLNKIEDQIDQAMETGEAIEITHLSYSDNDTTFFYNISIIPLRPREEFDTVIRIVDITEKTRMEEMLIQSEKLLSIGSLAAGMAHEINSPLSLIINSAELLLDMLNSYPSPASPNEIASAIKQCDPEEVAELISHILESGNRADKIIKNMLGFVRVSNNDKELCNIGVLMENTLQMMNSDYDFKTHYAFSDIQIIKDYKTKSLDVVCDSGKIQQVLLNILKNAGQALFENKTTSPKIIIRIKRKSKNLQIEIEDNGPGIPENISRRIFDPFFTTKPRGEGTGLGLSISYSIITKDHKGTMHIEEISPTGTKFVFTLPL